MNLSVTVYLSYSHYPTLLIKEYKSVDSFLVILSMVKCNPTVIIMGDVWNTEFDTFDERSFGTLTAVSSMDNVVCPDLSVYGK